MARRAVVVARGVLFPVVTVYPIPWDPGSQHTLHGGSHIVRQLSVYFISVNERAQATRNNTIPVGSYNNTIPAGIV